jgi:hydrogenase nickel incorporation protein HypA/HybF
MHELSIARALLAAAAPRVPAGTRATRVRVAVGAATGIVPAALQLAFRAAADGTDFAGAALDVERRSSPCRCSSCGAPFALDAPLGRCPACGTLGGELLSAGELELTSIEVVDV